ncbi:hypothetical protein HGM15179_001581 [Zosterops borbonicus]|uniref:Nucleoplasmin core domain-containing protein n=1 Tax=Zosterops borbonicus TaxID=364589 RepID=A0A8K1GWV4_9PASS|nr:hypothetical protein HGM15179_001581 [Zosterops borbonicus]
MEPHGPACPGSVLFGCELTASTKSYTFQVDEEDDSDHILALSVVCLTDGAKDECNVVEVVGRNHENQEIAVPVANLKLSCQPLLSLDNFKLQPPVTFRLAAGSGPVHLAGWHRIISLAFSAHVNAHPSPPCLTLDVVVREKLHGLFCPGTASEEARETPQEMQHPIILEFSSSARTHRGLQDCTETRHGLGMEAGKGHSSVPVPIPVWEDEELGLDED